VARQQVEKARPGTLATSLGSVFKLLNFFGLTGRRNPAQGSAKRYPGKRNHNVRRSVRAQEVLQTHLILHDLLKTEARISRPAQASLGLGETDFSTGLDLRMAPLEVPFVFGAVGPEPVLEKRQGLEHFRRRKLAELRLNFGEDHAYSLAESRG
jgi:hypothetical protein